MYHWRPFLFSIHHLLAEIIHLVIRESDPKRHFEISDQWFLSRWRMDTDPCWGQDVTPGGKCHHHHWSRPWPTTNWASLTPRWCSQLIQFCTFASSWAYHPLRNAKLSAFVILRSSSQNMFKKRVDNIQTDIITSVDKFDARYSPLSMHYALCIPQVRLFMSF